MNFYISLAEIMSQNPITVPFDFTMEETAELLLENKISGVPVIDYDGQIVGMITQTDVFKMMISVTGLTGKKHTQGIQFAFQVEDHPGSIKEVADIIRKYNGRLGSILSSYENVPEGFRKIYIRSFGLDREKIPEIMEEFKKITTVLYMIDHRLNKREIFQ